MPVFEYTARNLKGELVRDKIDLASRDDVIAHLRKNRMIVVQVREAKGKGGGIADLFKAGIKTRDVVIFTRQFATMINAGLPMVQCLDILSQQTEKEFFRTSIARVMTDVEGGSTLGEAMSKHPKIFTQLYVNMVEAGEAGGILDVILVRLATFLEKLDQRLEWQPLGAGSLEKDGALEWRAWQVTPEGARWRRSNGSPTSNRVR